MEIHLNRDSIKTKGKSAIGNFLKHLQVYKSSADFKAGSEYFNHFLEVSILLRRWTNRPSNTRRSWRRTRGQEGFQSNPTLSSTSRGSRDTKSTRPTAMGASIPLLPITRNAPSRSWRSGRRTTRSLSIDPVQTANVNNKQTICCLFIR